MNKIILVAVLSVSFFGVVNAQDTQDLAKRLDVAKEYSKAVPIKEEVQNTIDSLIIRVPMDERAQFKSVLERTIKVDRLESISEMALAETFTEDELKALVAFYSSPEGASIRQKMPEYQSRIKPVFESMMREAVQTMAAQK